LVEVHEGRGRVGRVRPFFTSPAGTADFRAVASDRVPGRREYMRLVRTIADMRRCLETPRRAGRTIGLVATMGCFHNGHLALMERARAGCDVVVVSVYVNPTQFAEGEDFERYPRDLERDVRLARDVPVDFLFAPSDSEMYPSGFDTVVDVPKLGGLLEGALRPGHFQGVATVVTKLFNIVQPDRAYFGEKDYQQLFLIRRMVRDLDFPIEIVGVPTVREADGLACSSRNRYLTREQRRAAARLHEALDYAESLVLQGVRNGRSLREKVREFVEAEPLTEPEIVAVCDPDTLHDIHGAVGKRVVVLLFVRVGEALLLDHRVITAAGVG